ncbi:MAG: YeeE/YedE thiosulfate transporter family protein [Acidocella sp.]|nr:YeeE/YedE thiosulfate transporter family protein [Acidocella sp.]
MSVFAHAMPLAGLAGGLMIGLSAALMLLADGRIAGVSGLAARVVGVGLSSAPYSVAAAFILGLPLGSMLVAALQGHVVACFPGSAPLIMIGGLAVGFGTQLGAGCTSGHGVCGMSRLSVRSIAATLTFMGAGVATVAAMRCFGVAG